MRRRSGLVMAGAVVSIALALASLQPASVAQDGTDALAAHDLLWIQAAAAALAIAAVPDVEAAPVADLRSVQTRLERAVVRLIESRPPLERLAQHLQVLPFLQEVTSASLAVLEARDAGDAPALASAHAWLDESLARLSGALRMARSGRS